MKPLVENALSVARNQVGVREEPPGSNTGRMVSQYLSSVGLAPGYPWCAAFVYWVIEFAGWVLRMTELPFIRTASCEMIRRWAEENDLLRSHPVPGDVFLYVASGRASHTGFVTSVNGVRFTTIEGNTNLGGSREGIGVFQRSRPLSGPYQFVRWGDLLPDGSDWTWALNDKPLGEMTLIGGRGYVPVRLWGQALGFQVGWDGDAQAPTIDSEILPVQVALRDGTALAPLRDLAELAKLTVTTDDAARIARVTRP